MALIGVTNCRKIEDYKQSVLHVGGELRLLDPSTDIPGALEGLDGLLLTGGGDVSSAWRAPHPSIEAAEPGRRFAGLVAGLKVGLDPRDLPRGAGAERRVAAPRAGHPSRCPARSCIGSRSRRIRPSSCHEI
jgi:hypothetical protein